MTFAPVSIRRATALLVAALVACLAVFAAAGASSGQAGTIFACKKKGNGMLRIVSKRTVCKRSESKMSWGTRGPKGPRGKKGKNGAAGPAGPGGPAGPSSYVGLGPLTIPLSGNKTTLYDLGYGVQIQVQCSGSQSKLTPEVFVTNTAENTYLSAFSAGPTYAPPIREKMATAAGVNSVRVSSTFSSENTASVSSQVFVSVLQLADTSAPKMFFATVVPWAEAQTTTCKFAGGLTRVAG